MDCACYARKEEWLVFANAVLAGGKYYNCSCFIHNCCAAFGYVGIKEKKLETYSVACSFGFRCCCLYRLVLFLAGRGIGKWRNVPFYYP